MNNELIGVKNISVKYGSEIIFENINFSVKKGDYIGIVGPNGAGKTTLIKAIAGLIKIDTGDILFPFSQKEKFKKIGYIPQKAMTGDKVFPASVKEIVKSGLISQKEFPRLFGKEDDRKTLEIMEKFKLTDIQKKRFGDLSGGQQQRVLLARAIISEPEILILDEPTSALDVNIRNEFYTLLKELNSNNGITLLFVSHDIATIGNYANKMLYIDRKLVFYGNFDEFCASSEMGTYFGISSQHQICWRHKDGKCIHGNN